MRQLLQDDGQTGNIGRLIGRKSEQHLSVAEHLLRSGTQSCQFVSKIWRFGARWTRVSDSLGLARDKLFDSVAAPTFAKQHSAQGDNR
jgi:hypothetical protein